MNNTRLKLMQRVSNFVVALGEHALNGCPKSSEKLIEHRLSICESCHHFSGTHCDACGCACNGSRKFLNKLAWEDQHCPADKW